MKQHLINSKRFTAAIIAMALVAGSLITPQLLEAQSATQKVRLMADTLRARDSGNLDLAKQKAEELIIIAPEDENVQRLLASINRDLESQMTGPTSAAPAVFGQAEAVSVEEVMEAELATDVDVAGAEDAASTDSAEIGDDSVMAEALAQQTEAIEAADSAITQAYLLADMGEFSAANAALDSAATGLPRNTGTETTFAAIEEAKLDIILSQAKTLAASGDLKAAESMVESYREAGGNARKANALARSLDKQMSDPYQQDIKEVSPAYVDQSKKVRELLTRGRAQFLSGDYDGAQATFKEVEARDANNAEAKLLQTRIARILGDVHQQTRYKTREQMLTEVDQGWERPKVFDIAETDEEVTIDPGLREKLDKIIIPEVKFTSVELTRVLETLSELSAVYDPDNVGVNIVPIFKPGESNPKVSITLRKLSLDRVLEFVTQQVNFSYDVGTEVVTVQPSDGLGGISSMLNETFTIPQPVRRRIIGVDQARATETVNPFAAPVASGGGGSDDAEKFKSFFQRAGVNFALAGTDLAYTEDGTLYVTQTKRNLERLKRIIRSMKDVKQVEIEAKFLEVAQNDLEELGFNWGVSDGPQTLIEAGFPVPDQFGNPTVEYQRRSQTQGRTINNAFSTDTATSAINISGFDPISVSPPTLNTSIDLASGAGDLFNATGWTVLGADVQLAIRALSRKSSTDVMSAPKVTVLSENEAQITVAQELRYPESYGEIQSEVGNGGGGGNNNNNNGGGGSSISITAATPEEFVTRNVGVELSVTPVVEEDDSITLTLSPSVTEFEGFVEYGGPSVAISPGNPGILDPITGLLTGGTEATVVTVPAGFYQPIFSTRRISTTVSVYDGATLVMGGLTRDEIKSFNDKVPVLGSIPGVGRLFRSEGETRQKRNLLIFVTANIVTPGGSPANQNYRNVKANSLYQNPTIMTPAGSVNRNIDDLAQ